jgi:methylisocitrate lyase
VTLPEMVDRIKAAVDARSDPEFVIIARTDALASQGRQSALDRLAACIEAGADVAFPEAVHDLEGFRDFARALPAPILANITEFGQTPLLTVDELAAAGVAIALYPLSAFRAMNRAAQRTYAAIRRDGTQRAMLDEMQTRMELYESIGYFAYEEKLDALYAGRTA